VQRGDHLWLFQLHRPSVGVPTRFSAMLREHVGELPRRLGLPNLKVSRRSTLPTPLVIPRIDGWPRTDLGLHVVNDDYNAMLVTYSYFEGPGGRHYIPHLQLPPLRDYADRVAAAWSEVACECHRDSATCCGVGCYSCFRLDCRYCEGTGWRHFVEWMKAGYAVDYSSGFPLAECKGERLTGP
jgi:hypothetical protein